MYMRIQIYFHGRGRGGSQGIVLFARRKGECLRPHLYIYIYYVILIRLNFQEGGGPNHPSPTPSLNNRI